MPAKRGPKSMSNEHKAAMEAGRAEGRAVRDYLEALRANKPRRGRTRTTAPINKRLTAIAAALPTASASGEPKPVHERRDREAELGALEAKFVDVAKTYAERSGIS